MKYDLTITNEALVYILKEGEILFPNEDIVIVLAQLHMIGGLMIPEIHSQNQMFSTQNQAFDELFPRGYKSYPFSVFVDHQAQVEDTIPNEFVIDLVKSQKGIPTLIFKNPIFE